MSSDYEMWRTLPNINIDSLISDSTLDVSRLLEPKSSSPIAVCGFLVKLYCWISLSWTNLMDGMIWPHTQPDTNATDAICSVTFLLTFAFISQSSTLLSTFVVGKTGRSEVGCKSIEYFRPSKRIRRFSEGASPCFATFAAISYVLITVNCKWMLQNN